MKEGEENLPKDEKTVTEEGCDCDAKPESDENETIDEEYKKFDAMISIIHSAGMWSEGREA